MSLHYFPAEGRASKGHCIEHGGSAECRCAAPFLPRWVTATLDEIDYGMLLLEREARVLHVNHPARLELDDPEHPLQLIGNELRARHPQDVAPLHDALQAAVRDGKRKLLTLGHGARRVSMAIVPLMELDEPATLITLGKSQLCSTLSVDGYARAHGLTPAETQVLQALCEGAEPSEIATRQGVELSTVRTQIASMRAKTGAGSIRDLERRVAVLPPLVGRLRMARPFLQH